MIRKSLGLLGASLLATGLVLLLTGQQADAGPSAPVIQIAGFCEQHDYSNCPDGCVKQCVPSACSGNACTTDCEGPGSCYTRSMPQPTISPGF